jgi:GTP cyclohydrolase I
MSAPTALHALDDDPIDRDRAEAAVADLLTALGHDVAREHLSETPRRVVDGLLELMTPEPFTMTTFENDTGYEDLVVVRGIRFTSLCAHHLLPFRGEAVIAYLPGDRLVGLSKLARVVDRFARGLQVQESLTTQIADELDAALAPRGVGVVLRAEHLCMSIRGVRAPESITETTAFRGALADDVMLRSRILDDGRRS